jgi:hypothetical protein
MITIAIEEINGYTRVDINSSEGIIELGELTDDEKVDLATKLIESASELLRDEYINYSNQLDEIVDELT